MVSLLIILLILVLQRPVKTTFLSFKETTPCPNGFAFVDPLNDNLHWWYHYMLANQKKYKHLISRPPWHLCTLSYSRGNTPFHLLLVPLSGHQISPFISFGQLIFLICKMSENTEKHKISIACLSDQQSKSQYYKTLFFCNCRFIFWQLINQLVSA